MILLIASFSSLLLLAVLGRHDPKRLRNTDQASSAHALSGTQRQWLFTLALCPGLLLAALVSGAAFFIWLSACMIGGWLISIWLA